MAYSFVHGAPGSGKFSDWSQLTDENRLSSPRALTSMSLTASLDRLTARAEPGS